MRFSVLGSGSRGNSVYIEGKKTGILIDAGFSGKEIAARLHAIGRDLADVHALCLTHEHQDHISGGGVLSRKCRIPVFANPETFGASEKNLGELYLRYEFATGEGFTFGDLHLRSFRLSHDAVDPVGFIVSDGQSRLGYCTDTGKVSHLMAERLRGCEALILEFNHDLEMLRNGPYPFALQQRVRSSRGHLCNDDAAAFLSQLLHDKLQHVVLAHLSETNNTPVLAKNAAHSRISELGEIKLHIGQQRAALPILEIR